MTPAAHTKGSLPPPPRSHTTQTFSPRSGGKKTSKLYTATLLQISFSSLPYFSVFSLDYHHSNHDTPPPPPERWTSSRAFAFLSNRTTFLPYGVVVKSLSSKGKLGSGERKMHNTWWTTLALYIFPPCLHVITTFHQLVTSTLHTEWERGEKIANSALFGQY